jgi:hypothetical protein
MVFLKMVGEKQLMWFHDLKVRFWKHNRRWSLCWFEPETWKGKHILYVSCINLLILSNYTSKSRSTNAEPYSLHDSNSGHENPARAPPFLRFHWFMCSLAKNWRILNEGIEPQKNTEPHGFCWWPSLKSSCFPMGKAIAPRTGAAQSTRARVPPCPAAPVPGNTRDGGGCLRNQRFLWIWYDLVWIYILYIYGWLKFVWNYVHWNGSRFMSDHLCGFILWI